MRLAFATNAEWLNLTEDDQLAAKAILEDGIEVVPARWDDDQVDWTSFDAVILRSMWDYHQRAQEFSAWLDRLDSSGVSVFNPLEIVHWNMDKTYLHDLQEDGIRIVPSVWLPQGAKVDLTDLMKQKGWAKIVVKPTISASAHQTYIYLDRDVKEAKLKLSQLQAQGGVIVQTFMDEVQIEGEWSLMFFDNQFSHAVLKKPKAGDFRVQWEHGGSSATATPSSDLIAQAQNIVRQVESDLLYARVDGVVRSNEFFLMELELIEPFLFFGYDSAAPSRFASALRNLLAVRQN